MYTKKMLIILMLVLALFVPKIYAQWSWQNPKPQGNTLNSIKYVSPTTAYAVGNLGVIMKTTNGGTDWEFQNSGVTANLKSVTFVNPEVGWATGALGGKVLRTLDGGATWQKMNATYYDLNSIFFINESFGWAVGTAGLIIKTTNGGQSWSLKQQSQGYHLNSVFFVNPELGWTVSDRGNILKSFDGGNTWSAQTSGNTYYQSEVYFIDEANGWIAADYGTIMRTTDGGNQWTQAVQLGGTFYSLQFVNPSVGYVVGVHGLTGKIHKTTDGGVSWTQQTSGSSKSLNSINFFEHSNEGLIVGEAGTTLKTTNGGNEWTSLSSGAGAYLQSVFFVDHNTGWFVGQNNDVRKTTDGGRNWIVQSTSGGLWHYSVFFINQNIGWIAGSYGKIFKTTDGGTNWVAQSSGITDQYLLSIRFVDENVGWAVGTNGKIIKTTNGGTTWTAQTSGATSTLTSAAFDNQNTGWVAGQNGLILKTTDGGTSWVTQTSGITSTLISIDFINSTTGWAVGSSGKILKTTDAGTTWTAQTSGITYGLNSVHFIDLDIGWATGSLGKILKTTNGGTTWTTESSYTVNDLLGTFFVDEFTGWAVGVNGIVLKHQMTPTISLSAPNGGEPWGVGSNQSITWSSNYARNLDIAYSTNDGSVWTNIISGTPAGNGSYPWTVPNTVSTNCKVKINTSGVPRFIDTSDNVFTIFKPEIVLTNPNGGENWKIGNVDTIKWTNSYVNHVKITYTTNNGSDWISVTDSASATDGRFAWTIPNTPSSNCKIQVIDLSSATVGDTSASTFTISKIQFTLSTPNGGESWQVGSQRNIIWNSSFVMGSSVAKKDIREVESVNVKLEYSTDNGLNWTEIIANAPNSGSYSWLIPNTPSTNCKVRISNASDNNISDTSDNVFTILEPPTVPVLALPSNNSNGLVQPITTMWNKSLRVEKYILQLSDSSSFTSIAYADSNLTDTTKQLPSLSNYTQYYWRVKAVNIDGGSEWSEVWNFKTLGNPYASTLVTPNDNSVNQPINGLVFNWTKPQERIVTILRTKQQERIATILNYQYQLSTDSLFGSFVVNDSSMTDTTRTMNNLTYLTKYFWRVRASNETGWGDWSEVSRFTTIIEKPTVPVLALPSNNSKGLIQPVNLVWNKSLRAEEYSLLVSDTSSFTSIVYSDTALTDTFKLLPQLSLLKKYYWKVTAKNIGGVSDTSDVWNFITLGLPTTVNLIYPENNAQNVPTSFTFVWNKANNQETTLNYWFELAVDTIGIVIVLDSTLTDTTKSVSSLPNDETHYWRVKAKNESGWGSFSGWNKFKTVVPHTSVPALNSPDNNSMYVSIAPTLRWHKSSYGVNYHLQASKDSLFTTFVYNDSTLSDTLKVMDTLQYKTKYYWQVRSKNIAGWSGFSVVWQFRTKIQLIDAPSGLVAQAANYGEVNLQWKDNSTNELGFVILRKDGDSLSTNQLAILDTVSANVTAYTDTTVGDLMKYSYRMLAYNIDTLSSQSNYATLVTLTNVKEILAGAIPKEYSLSQNYPNPFNPSTTIRYGFPFTSNVTIDVYNMIGQKISRLIEGEQSAGYHEATFQIDGLPSGIYFYVINAKQTDGEKNFYQVRKMMLMK